MNMELHHSTLTYKGLVSNVDFKIYYGQDFKDAEIILDFDVYDGETLEGSYSKAFKITDLYVQLNNHNFGGWDLFAYNDDGTYESQSLGALTFEENDKYFESYAKDWRSVSNYGTVELDGTPYAIQHDWVIDAGEITERLYIENYILAERCYILDLDHIVSDGHKNNKFNFDDLGLYLIKDGEEYTIYEGLDNGYFVYKNTGSSYVTGLSSSQINSVTSKISSYISNYVTTSNKTFTLKAIWNKISRNLTESTITSINANNSSTGKIQFNYEDYYIYSKRNGTGYDLYILYDGQELKLDFQYEFPGNIETIVYDGEYMRYKGFKIIGNDGVFVKYLDDSNGYISYKSDLWRGYIKCYSYLNGFRVTIADGSSINWSRMNHFTGYNNDANPGLGGIYETYSYDDKSDLTVIENNVSTPSSDYYQFISSFVYGENKIVNIAPYHNGRYLTELAFEFDILDEKPETSLRFASVGIKHIDSVKIKIIFDLFFDSENRTIGVDSISFFRSDVEGSIAFISRKTTLDIADYLTWWQDESKIDTLKSENYQIAKQMISRYVPFMFEGDFISVGEYLDASKTGVVGFYGRKDINITTLKLKELKKDINISAKFAVQTYDFNFYTILNDTYDAQINSDGEGISTPYMTLDELQKDVDSIYSTESNKYKFNQTTGDYPKFVTIKEDIPSYIGTENEKVNNKYNVPYGYFAYGYKITSNYVGYRPIDQAILLDPYYGFDYIY